MGFVSALKRHTIEALRLKRCNIHGVRRYKQMERSIYISLAEPTSSIIDTDLCDFHVMQKISKWEHIRHLTDQI